MRFTLQPNDPSKPKNVNYSERARTENFQRSSYYLVAVAVDKKSQANRGLGEHARSCLLALLFLLKES